MPEYSDHIPIISDLGDELQVVTAEDGQVCLLLWPDDKDIWLSPADARRLLRYLQDACSP